LTTATPLERGRRAFERGACELLGVAAQESPLEPDDLGLAGRAAYLCGRDEDSLALLERSFHERMRRGDRTVPRWTGSGSVSR
jgi:hypothetical protein